MKYEKEIITPITQTKVVIKTMLTGLDREAIETAGMDDATIGSKGEVVIKDVKKMVLAQKYAAMDVSVVSVNGSPAETRQKLLQLPEHDTQFVIDAIESEQKKTSAAATAS